MRKTDKRKYIYNIPQSANFLRDQLGLNIHTAEAETVAIPNRNSKQAKASFLNDIDLNNWRQYSDIITDSLWLLGGRDKRGAHSGELHGNFIPQIPHQAILRYTKRGETVLDTFLGGGTTLIECKHLGRHGIGIEINEQILQRSRGLIAGEDNPYNVKTFALEGDSSDSAISTKVKHIFRHELNSKNVQLLIMHPPYFDIIKFGAEKGNLCNASGLEEFLSKFSEIVKNFSDLLEQKRYLVLVIGDKYTNGEWVPLSFYTMQRVLENGFKLKSIVVKNIAGNRAKRNLDNFWRRRALAGGYYVFKHEYVMFFQKK